MNKIFLGMPSKKIVNYLNSKKVRYTYFGSVGADHEHYMDVTEISGKVNENNNTYVQIGTQKCLKNNELINNSDITYVNSSENSKLSIIGKDAFSDCSNIVSVNCLNILSVDNYAFCNCINLQNVNLPNVKILGESAFLSSGISSINCPNLLSIGMGGFYECKNLKKLILSSVVEMPKTPYITTTFQSCTNVSVYIPDIQIPEGWSFFSQVFQWKFIKI